MHSVVNFNKQEGENSIRLLICSSFESPTRPCNHDDRYGRHLRAIFQIPTSFLPELLAEEELAAKNEPISKGPISLKRLLCAAYVILRRGLNLRVNQSDGGLRTKIPRRLKCPPVHADVEQRV